MPVVSAGDLTKLRTTIHKTNLGLCVYVAPMIWTAQVDGAQTRGDTTITVKNVVNTRTPANHMQVLIGSTAGARDLGEARWRSYSAPTLTLAIHNCDLPDNAYITVKEEIKPDSIHIGVDANDVIFEDGDIAYTDENENYQPIARTGTHAVLYRDPDTGLATGQFYGSRSSAMTAGATLTNWSWSFRGGTPNTSTSQGTAGAPISVTWDTIGDYYCSLAVTDSNGKTHTRYFVVFVRDQNGAIAYNGANGTTPYRQVEISSMEGDVDSGVWNASIRVYTDASQDVFAPRALCVIHADDWYGDTAGSIGNELYRENIVMVGYIKSNSVKRNWSSAGYVEFELQSISGVMQEISELAGELELTAGTPSGWHVLQNLTFNLGAHHVLTQHCTVSQITDCYFDLPDFQIDFIDLTEGSMIDQMTPLVGAVAGRMGCNAQGHFYLEPNPQLVAIASRSTDYTIQSTFADLRGEIDLGDERHAKPVSQIDFWGEDATGTPFNSLAPSNPWGTGKAETIDGIRVADQTAANELAGLYEGYRNNPFSDLSIDWRGNYRIFDVFPAEPIALNITAAQNRRGIVWTNQRAWVKRVSYSYTPGILLTSTVVEIDSGNQPGVEIIDGEIGTFPTVIPTIPSLPPPITYPGLPLPTVSDEEVYTISGTLTAAAGGLRLYNRSARNWTLSVVYISVGTAPTGASIIIDVNLNGTTIFSTQANRPAITAGNYTGSGTPNTKTISPGNYLTVDIDQVGSTIAGGDLTVQFPMMR